LIAAKEAGLTVPDDLSIIGIDDIDASSTTSPPLTTVAKPKYEIGVQAATLLLERMRGEQPGAPRKIVLEGELRVRNSTCPPR